MKTPATEKCRYRAACNDSAKAYNAKVKPWGFLAHIRTSFPNLHMRWKRPGWVREYRWSPRHSYAERKAISPYKGYAPLMDGTRMAEPKWLQRRRGARAET